MEERFWIDKWEKGEIGFHQNEFNSNLVKYSGKFFKDCSKVFVPLCGKTKDMIFLIGKGFKVVGIDLSEKAIISFFEENNFSYKSQIYDGYELYINENVTLIRGNIFEVPLTLFEEIDAIYDRASLVALPIELRIKYVDFILNNLNKCKMMLQTLAFDNRELGPPFSIEEDDVRNYFGKIFSIECISKTELDAEGMHGGKITKLHNLAFLME